MSLTNTSLDNPEKVTVDLAGLGLKLAGGEILTAASVNDYNDFGQPEKVTLKPFKDFKTSKSDITAKLPSKSIVNLSIPL